MDRYRDNDLLDLELLFKAFPQVIELIEILKYYRSQLLDGDAAEAIGSIAVDISETLTAIENWKEEIELIKEQISFVPTFTKAEIVSENEKAHEGLEEIERSINAVLHDHIKPIEKNIATLCEV